MSDELKPCPFCGGEPKLKRHDDTFIVVCEHHEWSKLNADGIRTAGDIAIYADMQGEYNFDTHELEYAPEEIERCKNAVIEAWNTRADSTYYRAVPEGYLVVPVPDKTVTQISTASGRFGMTDLVDTYSRVLEKRVQDEIITKSLENCGYIKKRTCHKELMTTEDYAGTEVYCFGCSECGESLSYPDCYGLYDGPNYCPNCGAKVVE